MPSKSRPPTTASSKPTSKPKPTPFTPRTPISPDERLKKLYGGLVDQINEGYYDNAVRTCRKILTLQPTSIPTYKTLLFLLLQTDRYSDALEVFEQYNPGEASRAELDFEKAYCLYRLHRPVEALKLIQGNEEEEEEEKAGEGKERYDEDQGRRVGHLKGQILYRAGEFERAEKVYDELLDSCPADSPESTDITENLASTQTHLEFQRTGYRVQLGGAFRQGDDVERDLPVLPKREDAGVRAAQASGSGSVGVELRGKKDEAGKVRRTRHRLPKGVKSASEPFEEDPDRWLPLPLRRSYQHSQLAAAGGASGGKKKKKGGKEVSGLGMQGAVGGGDEGRGGGGGGGGSGGQKGKKGKRGK